MRWRAAVLAVALLAISTGAQAQGGYWWGGLGMNIPSGDTSDGVDSGIMGTAGIGWNLKSMKNWSLQLEGMMSKNRYCHREYHCSNKDNCNQTVCAHSCRSYFLFF